MIAVILGTLVLDNPLEFFYLLVRLFEYDDVPLTQEIIDKHLVNLNKPIAELTDEYLVLYENIMGDTNIDREEAFMFVYPRIGERIQVENNTLILPKIIIGKMEWPT